MELKIKLHPGEPFDKDLYDLPPEEVKLSLLFVDHLEKQWKA